MNDPLQNTGAGALDALLKSNKEQFDRKFANQMHEADAAGLRQGDAGAPANAALGAPTVPGSRVGSAQSRIDTMLNSRLGRGWSEELVETKVTNGSLSALCRLTHEGKSALEFGAAPVKGDEDRALEEARFDALEKCAEALTGSELKSTRLDDRTVPRSAPTRTESAPALSGAPNTISLDLVEAALRQSRREMGVVLSKAALSDVVRQKHADSPTIADARGQALIGKPAGSIARLLRDMAGDLHPGDVYLQSDPYLAGGGTHLNTWILYAPIFHGDDLVGFSIVSAQMADVGGPVHGSMTNTARSVFGEGLRIPPVRVFERGAANHSALDIILGNTRSPETNHGDLLAMVAAIQVGEHAVLDLCDRFGVEMWKQVSRAILDRTNKAVRNLIVQHLPEEPKSFEDVVDDDGLGNGPFRLKLAVWREGEQAFFDWTGTSGQAEGPINLNLEDEAFAVMAGTLLIKKFDPEIAANAGFLELLHTTIPEGTLLRPHFPAALGGQAHTLARLYDVLNGVLGQCAPSSATAAGYGSGPLLIFAGLDANGRVFHVADRVFGGTPGTAGRDGKDGQSLSSGTKSRPAEQLENDYPMMVERCRTVADSGGAGAHPGGCGIEKVYVFLQAGEISLRDDRHQSQPWGVAGGKPGMTSDKVLLRADGSREALASKLDAYKVGPGDKLFFRTAGAGGWGNPVDRDVAAVRRDVAAQLVSTNAARDQYGVVIVDGNVDAKATRDLRDSLARSRRKIRQFDFGDRASDGR